jgi:glycosyltransferase involved in cell wall biosynthesis
MSDLVSVIIPVYNVRDYLHKCIDSVKTQTYTNLQIILVDDGSADGSGEICDEAATRDQRITVIHQANGGLSAARNKGLETATGKYVCFLDGDDWFDNRFVEELLNLAETRNADITVCDFVRVSDENEVKSGKVTDSKDEPIEYDNKQAVREVIEQKRINSLTWNKLYKRELWEGIRFPEEKLHEDEYTTYRLLWKAKKVVETREVLYYYRKRASSVTETSDRVIIRKRAFDIVKAKEERYLYFSERDDILAGASFIHYMDGLKYVIRSGMLSDPADKNTVIKKYVEYSGRIWKTPHVSLYKRMALSVWKAVIRLI